MYVRQYCAEIDEAARNRIKLIVRSLAEQNGVTEQLKAENQMEWVRQMNACKAQAEEIVKAELIYDWRGSPGRKLFGLFSYIKMTVELFTILWYNLNTKSEQTNQDLRRINMTVDVYENCPIYENEYYMLRMTNKEDKADLLKYILMKKSVPFFNK